MKALFDNYLKELFSKSNQEQVISVGLLIFKIILFLFIILLLGKPEILNSNGIWTLITALFSAPILFLIWRFRDQNATQQIENQRKDINLKEFQKIAEWVSGLHLVENEITEKETKESDDIKSETTTKYSLPDESRSIPTFSKSDGAVGLQIAAIHSLLPFFRGEHGESFHRPALNLLTSAWLSLQQKDLLELEKLDDLKQKGELSDSEWQQESKTQIKKIQKRANSPVGVALTQVLLSDGGNNLLKFPKVFPKLCLSGMNFHLPGLEQDVLSLFKQAKQCQGINLIGANLREANLERADLISAHLEGADLRSAHLKGANLSSANLEGADLSSANLEGANLSLANLEGADLSSAHLEGANLSSAHLEEANLKGANLSSANLEGADLSSAHLEGADLSFAHLEGADLSSAHLEGADLRSAHLKGAIVYYNNTRSEEIKAQGGIVLYLKENPDCRLHKLKAKRNKKAFECELYDSIDLIKTQQANPDWEIFIEEIK